MNDSPTADPTPEQTAQSSVFYQRVQMRFESQLGRLVASDVTSQVQIEMLTEANTELEKLVEEQASEIAALKEMLGADGGQENTKETKPKK